MVFLERKTFYFKIGLRGSQAPLGFKKGEIKFFPVCYIPVSNKTSTLQWVFFAGGYRKLCYARVKKRIRFFFLYYFGGIWTPRFSFPPTPRVFFSAKGGFTPSKPLPPERK